MCENCELRRTAMRRRLAGERVTDICRDLGKSRGWFYYWDNRYDPDDLTSLCDLPLGPREPAGKTSPDVEQAVINSRRAREKKETPDMQYALIGAEAIQLELTTLDMEGVPTPRTVHRILKRNDLIPSREAPSTPDKPKKPYPTPEANKVNAVHQFDWIGPRYLSGDSTKYYFPHLKDRRSRRFNLDCVTDRQSETLTHFLVASWQWMGIPDILQVDNAMEIIGTSRYPRSFTQAVRFCLDVGVEVLFNAPGEPWRNGFIETGNGLVQRLLFQQPFENYAALQAEVPNFVRYCNRHHRHSALEGQTADEYCADLELNLLPSDYEKYLKRLPLRRGRISFIRMVSKNGNIRTLRSDKFHVDPQLKWQYVKATVIVENQILEVYHEGELIKTFEYRL